MKNLLCFVTLFIVFNVTTLAQNNIVYLSLQPQDLGIGIRLDHMIKPTYGIYGSFTKGKYPLYDNNYMLHDKAEIGIIAITDNCNYPSFSTIGISWNRYDQKIYSLLPAKAMNPISLDIGAGIMLHRIAFGVRFDPIKWEGTIDIGIILNI